VIARESRGNFSVGKRWLAAILTLLRFGNSQVSMPYGAQWNCAGGDNLRRLDQYGSEGGHLKAPFGPQFDATGVSEAAGQRTDGAAKVEQRQFEISVTVASALYAEQNGTRCCIVD
jgi:hypothetical protein